LGCSGLQPLTHSFPNTARADAGMTCPTLLLDVPRLDGLRVVVMVAALAAAALLVLWQGSHAISYMGRAPLQQSVYERPVAMGTA
jgi:hypothetical protein